jgi:hypothetical protein
MAKFGLENMCGLFQKKGLGALIDGDQQAVHALWAVAIAVL